MKHIIRIRKYILFLAVLICFFSINGENVFSYESFDGNYSYNAMNNSKASSVSYDEELLILLDFSNSMSTKIDGYTRMELAINSLENILKEIPPDTKAGLRIFGTFVGGPMLNEGRDSYINRICRSTELVVPVSKYSSQSIAYNIKRFKLGNATPIFLGLKSAVERDFSYENNLKHIVLITDGQENCGGDPCNYVKNLMATRNNYRIDVVGISLLPNQYSGLNCIAKAGKGNFYNINNADEFKSSFRKAAGIRPSYNSRTQDNTGIQNIPVNSSGPVNYKQYVIQVDN